MTVGATPETLEPGALDVFRNRAFLRLWLSQAATQIGGNMVLYGLTVIVLQSTGLKTVVSVLILTFLLPAVLFSAVAGVYVDRLDRRRILIATNVLRGVGFLLLWLFGTNLAAILILNALISTVTVFFSPAEAAMIPLVVDRRLLLAANGIFTLTLNAAFALGFALLGPLIVNIASPSAVILIVAALYGLAAVFCFLLPPSPPPERDLHDDGRFGVRGAEQAFSSTIGQLREGIVFVRANRSITWSLIYLGIAASLVGVLGVLGGDFAKQTLGLDPKSFAVIVLPLGFGIVTGILLLNAYGRYLPRRRVIEGGLVALGVLLGLLAVSGPISRLLQRADAPGGIDLSGVTSLLAVVVVIALLAGIAYAAVAIPAQTQLQEDLPEDVRGRVFGILGMLLSVASFIPIIIVGPISDLVGTTVVLLTVAVVIAAAGIASIILRGPLAATDDKRAADPDTLDPIAAALGADRSTWRERNLDRSLPAPVPAIFASPVPDVPPPDHGPRSGAVPPTEDRSPAAGPSDPPDRD